ncbi:unnamed protein product [Danaus chrysippus]|uniref:(African queen) hypothetical protein n=1 Tax=Danaus chrysippus TaxID=151541 RepID=A0A8J2W7N0_9NEOP|nr:unnamed protein product [Danaus chrysippus]
MVRSLSQWTKTLSFPGEVVSPTATSKESMVNVTPGSPGVSPTPSAFISPARLRQNNFPDPYHRDQSNSKSPFHWGISESRKRLRLAGSFNHAQAALTLDLVIRWCTASTTRKAVPVVGRAPQTEGAPEPPASTDAVLCAAQCGAMIPRVLMQDHLRYTCSRRRANCEHCGKEFSGSALEEHQGNCGHEPVYCENKCGAKVQRRHTSQHAAQHCSKRLVPCRHCGQRYTQDTVSAHGALCSRAPVPCPQRCAAAPARDELDAHLREHCSATAAVCLYRDAGCRFKGTRQALERHTEESAQQHLALVSALATRQARQLESLRAATGQRRWPTLRTKDGVELTSPAFYTSQYGYKLQATLFLNGNGAGEGTHISVYIKIPAGRVRRAAPLAVRSTRCPSLCSTRARARSARATSWRASCRTPRGRTSSGRPRSRTRSASASPGFVSHEMLKKRNFVKDDVMFLRVKVDPSKIVAV